ncbi:MAG: hypothetical protein KKF78_03365, partial [Candidatus Omnitrophica bacterium]|nr:hypothetical protein [Candidatus Omnitrophota bacterium]
NERKIYDLLNKEKNINDETIYDMAKIVDIDLDFLLDKWELAEKEKGKILKIQYGNRSLFREHPAIINRIENSKQQNVQSNRTQDTQRSYNDNMIDQRERQLETQMEFKRARETARDQGF